MPPSTSCDVCVLRSKLVGRTYARYHQEAWRIDSTGTEQDLAVRLYHASRKLHAYAPIAFDCQASHLGSMKQIHLSILQHVQVGIRSLVSRVSLDAELVPTDARCRFAADIGGHPKSVFLRRRDEGRCNRSAIGHIGQ
jgi:hypothetical protein